MVRILAVLAILIATPAAAQKYVVLEAAIVGGSAAGAGVRTESSETLIPSFGYNLSKSWAAEVGLLNTTDIASNHRTTTPPTATTSTDTTRLWRVSGPRFSMVYTKRLDPRW